MNISYAESIAQAHAEIADIMKRGDAALGDTWDEYERENFTPDEIAQSHLEADLICARARAKKRCAKAKNTDRGADTTE